MNRQLASIAKISPNDTVLDAGCGVGGSAFWLAENLGAKVVGVNINQMQTEIARKQAVKKKIDKSVNFFVKDFMDTNFPDNSFDVVWGIESICYAESKRDFLAEAKRLMKNNGRIIIADGFLRKRHLSEEEEGDLHKWLEGWAVPHLVGVNDFRGYLEKLGFNNIEFRDITENVWPSSRKIFRTSCFAYPAGELLQTIGLRSKVQTNASLASRYQYLTLKRKLWVYGIFYAEG